MNLTSLRHYRRQLEDILRIELSVLERALEAAVARSATLQESVDCATDRFQSALVQGAIWQLGKQRQCSGMIQEFRRSRRHTIRMPSSRPSAPEKTSPCKARA